MVKKENKKKTNKRLDKAEFKMTHGEDVKPPRTAAIILLILMLSSIIGFVAISPGSSTSGEQDYSNLPFGEYQTQTGSVWAAVINGEQFIFTEVDSFIEKQELADIAFNIKNSNALSVYLDEGFENLDGAFLLEQKYSVAYEKPVTRAQNLSCETTTIVFTNNASNIDQENCLIIESELGEEAYDAQALSYYLVNDFQG